MSEKSEINKEHSSNSCSGTLEMVQKMKLLRMKLAQRRTNHNKGGQVQDLSGSLNIVAVLTHLKKIPSAKIYLSFRTNVS